jgi:hypothetical protein
MIKGAADWGSTDRQVRLAFTLWVRERVAVPRSPGAGPTARQ